MAAPNGPARQCERCVYACPMQDGPRTLLICANTPDAPGQIVRIAPDGACPRFRAKRGPALRLEPPPPPNDEIRYIPLTRGKFTIVDAADYDALAQHRWFANGNECTGFYAARWLQSKKLLLMHRVIMNPPDGMVVDHINGNPADNRRANLRICTRKQNARNARGVVGCSSRFKGVHFDSRYGKWVASIRCDGRTIHIGSFDDEIEAAKAYDRKARELFGEFAYLNFPEDA